MARPCRAWCVCVCVCVCARACAPYMCVQCVCVLCVRPAVAGRAQRACPPVAAAALLLYRGWFRLCCCSWLYHVWVFVESRYVRVCPASCCGADGCAPCVAVVVAATTSCELLLMLLT